VALVLSAAAGVSGKGRVSLRARAAGPGSCAASARYRRRLADPRARRQERRRDLAVRPAFYRLADDPRETILVACSKCEWKAAFLRDDLIASHGADYAMLDHLAAPGCSKLGSYWDRCGAHYVEPIEAT
jgi:hypothetical protein